MVDQKYNLLKQGSQIPEKNHLNKGNVGSDITVYEGDSAVEEVGEQDPVDDGGPHDGQHGEHGGQGGGPPAQQQPAQVIELRDLAGSAWKILMIIMFLRKSSVFPCLHTYEY